ncbi:MAG: DUF5995 family protein, partial [Candidatus Heimdallarchaeota archaeon]
MKTFEDVLFRFDQIIENSIEDSSVLGYFPILYREVTKEIEVQLTTGLFSNPTKVKNFTIRFVNKYFEVYDRDFEWQCWNLALNANESVLVFQHILLGINAH